MKIKLLDVLLRRVLLCQFNRDGEIKQNYIMRHHKFFTLFSLLIFLFNSSTAQEVWDWEKCIDYALKNNIQLKQSGLNLNLAEATLKQQKLNYSPNINGSSNYNLRVGNNFNFFTSEYTRETVHYQDYGVNISQPIFDGLITPNNIKKSKLDLETLKLDQEVLKSNIQLQILTAFLNIMNANEQYNQAFNQHSNTQKQYENTQTLIQAGAAAEKALLDIDAQLSGEELTIAQIKNQLDLAYLQLKVILQLDIEKNITVKIPELPKVLLLDPTEASSKIYEDALGLRPEIKSSKLKIQSAKYSINVAKGNYYPTLQLIANANTFFSSQSKITSQVFTGNTTAVGIVEGTFQRVLIPETLTQQSKNPYKNQLNQNLSYSFGLSLNIPIFNKYQVQTAVKQATIQYKNAILNEQQSEMDLFNTIQQAYLKAQAAIESFKSAEKNYQTSKKSCTYAEERLSAGSINQLELNLAKNNLLTAASKLTQAKYEYIFNTKVLDFYQGKPITLE